MKEKLWAVKVRVGYGKRWNFLTKGGSLNYLRVHARLFTTEISATREAERIARWAGHSTKVVRFR